MVTDDKWKARVKELAQRLGKIGVPTSAQVIANKFSRGGFSAVFFFQCLEAIECEYLDLKK